MSATAGAVALNDTGDMDVIIQPCGLRLHLLTWDSTCEAACFLLSQCGIHMMYTRNGTGLEFIFLSNYSYFMVRYKRTPTFKIYDFEKWWQRMAKPWGRKGRCLPGANIPKWWHQVDAYVRPLLIPSLSTNSFRQILCNTVRATINGWGYVQYCHRKLLLSIMIPVQWSCKLQKKHGTAAAVAAAHHES